MIAAASVRSHAALTLSLIQREVDSRYRGTFGGLAWYVFNNLAMLALYTVIFGLALKVRWPNTGDNPGDFALRLFTGLIVFNVMLEVLTRAPSLVVSNPNYVKKLVFPLEVLPIVALGAALFNAGIAFLVLLAGMVALGHPITPLVLAAPLVIAAMTPWLLGAAWALAALGVYVRDIGQVIPLLTTALLFISPVFFPPSALPAALHPIVALNPITAPVEAARALVLDATWPDAAPLLVHFVLGLGLAGLGYFWFRLTKRGFADVL